jgi:hypothetical protein
VLPRIALSAGDALRPIVLLAHALRLCSSRGQETAEPPDRKPVVTPLHAGN